MNKKLMTFWIIASMVVAMIAAPLSGVQIGKMASKDATGIRLFQSAKFDAHYRVPREVDVERLLVEEKVLPVGAKPEQVRSALQAFMDEFNERNPDTPNPEKLRELLKAERDPKAPQVIPATNLKSLVVPVEFPNSTDIAWCGEPVATFTGPLHNEIPAPGLRDNNTQWYEDSTPELYDELYFGTGPTAGVIINHPNLGEVDLRGYTMANYYLEQSEGAFQPTGMIYPDWIQADEAEAYYGQDSCTGSSHNINAQELVVEVIDKIIAANPDFPWEDFDGDGDGVVDNFTVIHAGAGQESGGGEQGDFSIWSHASIVNWPDGYTVCTAPSTGCPDRDITVYSYSMDPEHIDIGVISEEFGHAAFGLPDMYATDAQGSISNWAIMESGSWNGPLAGMIPAPFPLWFRMLVGWSQPVEIDFDDPETMVQVGQHSLRPTGTAQGIRINLPDKVITYNNLAGTGKGWWSDSGDLMSNTLVREFNLTGATNPVFSFTSYWDIEEDWDYGFVEVSTDGGATWTALDDTGNFFVNTDPNGNNPDLDWALTGWSAAAPTTLSFDLSPYAGGTIKLRLRYSTDMAASNPGWWGDDFSLDDGATNLFSDDVEGASTWTSNGWLVVPISGSFRQYYLAEWRNSSGFDRGLAYPYQTVYSDVDEWEVDRLPYTVPGMLLFFRDSSYGLDYTLSDALYDWPSVGPKHGISVVDSHWMPLTWDGAPFYTPTGGNVRLSDRHQPANATFTLQETTPFTLRRANTATGDVIETKTFDPQPPVSTFNDALAYYPGFAYYEGLPDPNDDGLYYWNTYASAVIPAWDAYTTRVTDPNNSPMLDLYGVDLGITVLGSGRPGDSDVEFGVHLEVVDQAEDGSWGMIKFWNAPWVEYLYYLPLAVQP